MERYSSNPCGHSIFVLMLNSIGVNLLSTLPSQKSVLKNKELQWLAFSVAFDGK
jgi:hypothetical protein